MGETKETFQKKDNPNWKKIKIFIFLAILLIIGSVIFVIAGGVDLGDGKTEKSDWVLYKNTPTTSTYHNVKTGEYQTTLYSGTMWTDSGNKRFLYYDTAPENATSLKGKGFNVVYISDDSNYKLDIIDFNYTSITYNLTVKNTGIVPIKVWEVNETKLADTSTVKDSYKDYSDVKTSISPIQSKAQSNYTSSFGVDKILEIGEHSTTITLQTANTENLKDAYVISSSPDENRGTTSNLVISNYHVNYISFNISSLNRKISSANATLSLYQYQNDISGGANVSVYHLYDDWKNGTGNNILTESQITWNNQPCGTSFTNSTNCNLTENNNFMNTSSGFYTWNVSNNLEIDKSRNNISFAIKNPSSVSGSKDISSKEYSTTSLRPKLTITYTPYIDILSPTPSQIFTQNSPTAYFNISTAVDMDVCYWSNNSGLTNHSMTLKNDSYFFNNTAGTLLMDGSSHSVTFYCNQSDDGTWRTSDTVNFEIDPINITTCRNLNVGGRNYSLMNNITGSFTNCLKFSNSSITLEGNDNIINITGGYISTADGVIQLYSYDKAIIKNIKIYSKGTDSNHQPTINIWTDYNQIFNCTLEGGAPNGNGVLTFESSSNYNNITNCQITSVGGSNREAVNTGVNQKGVGNRIIDTIINSSDRAISISKNGYSFILVNITYLNGTEYIVAGTSNLTRKWYFQPTVNNSAGNLANALVNIYNRTGSLVSSDLTGADGKITRQELTEYINTGTKSYVSPYTVNISLDGYITNSTTYNLTLLDNEFPLIVLNPSNTAPTAVSISPANNTNSSSPTAFNCSATDTQGLKNISLYIYNDDGSLNAKNSTSLTGTSNSTIFNQTMSDGTYYWNCLVYDNSTDSLYDFDTNRTITIDSTNPLISFGTGTENNNTNFSRNWVYVNTSWTETNFKNITFYLFNEAGIVNSTTYTIPTYLINFTNLIDGNYTYEVNITDVINHKNTTGIRRIIIDDTPPVIIIDFPANGGAYNFYNISFNYSVSDNLIGLSSCWYTNDTGKNNYTVTCNQNFTQNLSEGTYTYSIYSNDSLNNVVVATHSFQISTTSPAINLNIPLNNQWLADGTNVYFNFTATDTDGLDTCELWGNWTSWHMNYTWIKPNSGAMNYTRVNLTDGSYIWNVWCNDTLNNGGFSINRTVNIDLVYPSLNLSGYTPTTIYNENNVFIFANISDLHLSDIWIEINYTGTYQNITITDKVGETYNYTISSSVIDNFENISWYWYANDSANNINKSVLSSFKVSNRNPYNVNITYPLNNSFINSDSLIVTFSASDLDNDVLNYSTYNSTDGVTFSIFNSTPLTWTNFTGYNFSSGTVHYIYVTVNDTQLQNTSLTNIFTIDNINPNLISITKPDASPTPLCSVTNIPLNYYVNDTNLDRCEFNVTFGGALSTPHTILPGCLNTTFNVSYDNAVQTLNFMVVDKAGNSNSTSILIYLATTGPVCSPYVPPVSPGSGGAPPPQNATVLSFCGDGICQKPNDYGIMEDFYTCPSDCQSSFNLDEFFAQLFSNCVDNNESTICFWTSLFSQEGNLTQTAVIPFDLDTAVLNCFQNKPCYWKTSRGLIFLFLGVALILSLFLVKIPYEKGAKTKANIPKYFYYKIKKSRKRRYK